MRARAVVTRRLSAGLATISLRGEVLPWATRTVRKEHVCAVCGDPIPKGATAFGPVRETENRRLRICVPCVNPDDEAIS